MNDLKTIANLNKLSKYCENYAELADDLLSKTAEKKKKKKVKQRARGKVVFEYNDARLKDHSKDRFPINDENQARNAISRSHQFDKAPPWFRGSLKALQEAVARKVHKAYPSIDIASLKKKKTKKSALLAYELLEKYAELDKELF
jgi:ElaB/YqjD/DUF883 family membrane-anchored ribosome-binding protein